ncbi:MAG: aldehyde ferredoxin oxidoreductase family protein [Deltaproteobacteria bacterium]|nr:aldehyde ferredoxin oxidoreductase family protein [Deltaproteobacteria bacterium]
MNELCGFAGKILRVDLSEGKTWSEDLDDETLRKWVGGVGLGAKYLYEEVPPGVEWSDPENRLIWTTGPLAGSGVFGAGAFNITTKSPMTNTAASCQANGFFGAYLKFSGFDGIVFQGKSPHPVYLIIRNGQAEIRDARHLSGKDVQMVEDDLRKELGVGERDVSIYAIGPAGENKVRYSAIVGDRGHVAAHGGTGAVMGSKNLKAVVAYRGDLNFKISDPIALQEANRELYEFAKSWGPFQNFGTAGLLSGVYAAGALPVKNLTEHLFPEHEKMNGQYIRSHFKVQRKPCYKCPIAHVVEVTVTEGPYTGLVWEEPEYECLAGFGPMIGNTDLGAVVMLVREVDRLGIDGNEASWTLAWAMECFEKGVLTEKETEGLALHWGNVEAAKELLNRIAHREGYIGNLLADGVMRASKQIGGEAADWAVYTRKGATPRGHDHRARWAELFDTCMTNTSTIESTFGGTRPDMVDNIPPITDPYSHEEVSTLNAKFNGIRQFDDCLGTCRLASPHPKMVLKCFNAVTGWNWTLDDAFTAGRRIVNLLRVFNFKHGMKAEDERPSTRYGSIPVGGLAQGKNIMEKWDIMVKNYYELMGWDSETGKPLPETLKSLGLENVIKDLQ